MTESAPKPKTPSKIDQERRERMSGLVFKNGQNKLYRKSFEIHNPDGTTDNNPVATWMSSTSAAIDPRAYDILEKVCRDSNKLNSYLKAILDFELNHSDNIERHKNRPPIEEEILTVLKKHGYFLR